MNKQKKNKYGLLPLGTIEAATKGDPSALRAVLKHYESYIMALSVIRLRDDEGTPHWFIDETLRRELELRLLTKVVGFKFRAA